MAIQKLNPYLHFNGNAAEALAHYERALGANAEQVMRWGEMPGADKSAPGRDRIMHAMLRVGSAELMLADESIDSTNTVGSNVQVCLHFDDVADLTKRFEALAQGGEVKMAPQDTFWGATFGMLKDRFGVHWMFNCDKQA